MISGPCVGPTSSPSATFHGFSGLGWLIFQPVRSLPLKSVTGLPHFGALLRLRDGARLPVHVQVSPFGAATVPERVSPLSFPSNTMSRSLPSSSLGETNVSFPSENSTLGSSRAWPHRATIRAIKVPSFSDSSSHEGYSWSEAFNVRSQRPR